MSEHTGIFNRDGAPICSAYGRDEAWRCAELLLGTTRLEMEAAACYSAPVDIVKRGVDQ